MTLVLFDFIKQTINNYEKNYHTYEYLEKSLKQVFCNALKADDQSYIQISSRIKNKDSLKEKLIRNKFYLKYETPQDALNNLSDLIGLIIECRFIADESRIYNKLFDIFKPCDEEYFQCVYDPNVYLNLRMPQPQLQRNGFTIYRIDGHYLYNGSNVNFELQIKSLVHSFWSEVEHQVVYKNTNFVAYDTFMKNILGTIRDSLDVVDRQLEIVYKEILVNSGTSDYIGMDEHNFKMFVAKTINDLLMIKLTEEIGFTIDFKKCSAILSQFIYITDFLAAEQPQIKMVEYFEHLNLLRISDFSFTEEIKLELPYHHDDPFNNILGQYFESIMNVDYEWHVFFVMLFAIQSGNNIQDFTQFINVIKSLIAQPSWFDSCFASYPDIEKQQAKDTLMKELAICLVENGKIEIIHEDKLYRMMIIFREFVDNLQEEYQEYAKFASDTDFIKEILHRKISSIF
ncbi:MAG: RelA/spoT family protein [Erysipelotrichaceae bacterium]|nr:RelA/spoT family protein [Erysipelotrichaceae bacterium]MDY5251319.1 RelA/spoT family protein [Erysipelotrichaceae bacterium]